MTEPTPVMTARKTNVFLTMLPAALVVFAGFLTIGVPLPVLPLQVHQTLGMSTLVVGIVVGIHYVAALLTRSWAGTLADTRGAKPTIVFGCLSAALSGFVFLASVAFVATPALSAGILMLGRVLTGWAESLIITGALSWGVTRVGPLNAGKVIVWVGIAMFAAYATGAPAGMAIYNPAGFVGIAAATAIVPLIALAVVAFLPGVPVPVAAATRRRPPFREVFGSVWIPGLGLALCSSGFGVITAFIALLFVARGWGSASFAFTAFGVAFIFARLPFGHLPDKLGGAKVALVCVLIEAVGQVLIWRAGGVWMAYLGAAFTGFGYSLAFPGFGVEAVRRAPPQSRGVAMGTFVAFLDLSLGITGPAAGAIAHTFGFAAIYLAGAGTVLLSVLVAAYLLMNPPQTIASPLAATP